MKTIMTFDKKYPLYLLFALTACLSGCSLVEVENPSVTDETFLGTPESAESWLNGIKKQLAQTLNEVVVFTEMASDNYYNNSSLSNQVFDIPRLTPEDLDIHNTQMHISRLRNMALYGIEKVFPADRDAKPEDLAEVYFYGAYAYLLSGELFAYLPLRENEEAVPASEHFKKAIELLTQAITLTGEEERKNTYTLALARAYYHLGDAVQASEKAMTIVNRAPLHLRQARFDGLNGASNLLQSYTFSSSTNTFAPLPRLDFLDPKYFHVGTASTDQKSIALLKSEEAFLIAAEAALGESNTDLAKTLLKEMVANVVSTRPKATGINAKNSLRRGTRSDYPLSASTKVRFAPGQPLQEGLILDRANQDITVYQVSGTSVTIQDIDNVTSIDEALYLLCLLRQEIFISEGRRMTDLGMRFPVSLIERQNNVLIDERHLTAVVPTFIPSEREMDDFDHDLATETVTIKYDMNRILVQNKQHENILPLIK